MDERINELTSRWGNLEKSKRASRRQGFLTRLVVHSAQVHFEGANQDASYQLVMKDLRSDGAVSPAELYFFFRVNL